MLTTNSRWHLLRRSIRQHAASAAPLTDLRAYNPWKVGASADAPGPYLISYTEYRPNRLWDLPDIDRAGEKLGELLVQIEGTVGVMTYFQPRWLRGGSLSVWLHEDAMREFIRLPYHIEIMNKYRSRGHLRATRWWSDAFHLGQTLAEGQQRVEAGEGRPPDVGRPA